MCKDLVAAEVRHICNALSARADEVHALGKQTVLLQIFLERRGFKHKVFPILQPISSAVHLSPLIHIRQSLLLQGHASGDAMYCVVSRPT